MFVRYLRAVLWCVTSLLVLLTGVTGSLIGMTDGTPITAENREYDFDDDRLLLGGYNTNPADLRTARYAAEAGLDFLITGVTTEYLDECEKYGIGVIAKNYNAPAYYAYIYDDSTPSWYALNKDTNYTDHPALWGDDIIDEPHASQFEKLASITNSYYANVPGKLPLINLFPMYAKSEQLGNEPDIPELVKYLLPLTDYSDISIDRYKRHTSDYINSIGTSYISVDIYPFSQKVEKSGRIVKTTSEKWLRNLDILAEACKKTNRDLWVIVQSAGNISEGGKMRYCDDMEDIRQQVYASLAFGSRSLIYACYQTGWWDTDSHMLDSNGERTRTYYAVKQVNDELKAFSGPYGDYDYKGTYMINAPKVAGQRYNYLVNDDSGFKKPLIISKNGLLVGAFENSETGKQGYIITNMEELNLGRTATAAVKIPGASRITVYKDGMANSYDSDCFKLTLDPGEGVFITVD